MLGSSPKESAQPQNIFVSVFSCTWISIPITGSYARAADSVMVTAAAPL